jgi:hypothetical protein
MKVYLSGGSDDGLLIDDAPEPPGAVRRYFTLDGRNWSELYLYSDALPVKDGRRGMLRAGPDKPED